MKRNYIQKIHTDVKSNNPYDRTFSGTTLFSYLSSQQTAQAYLTDCYKRLSIKETPEMKSYENSDAFMYYITHGLSMYNEGQKLPLLLQPMLYFYGMTHLLKACLLTKRPEYPESTVHLAHGVSSRKRKKKNYTFLSDDLRVQQKGLFPYFAKHLYDLDCTQFDKVNMKDLLNRIPELIPLFQLHGERSLIHIGTIDENTLTLPLEILDNYHVTYETFKKRLSISVPQIVETRKDKFNIIATTTGNNLIDQAPFFICNKNNMIYFPLEKSIVNQMNEVMIHYLILYNLSMLARYEASWWGELLSIKHDFDYPVIEQFLQITARKIPVLLSNFLEKNIKN